MAKEVIISERENIAATLENGKVIDFFMNEGEQLVGDIILGKVDSIASSIDAAFISIGKNRNGFIHITDLTIKNAKKRTGIRSHLQPKQNILVQVAKEATGNKGPRLTEMITIPGKYMVLTPYERKIGISKKITDSFERDRLVYIAKNICQSGYGIIVRTEAIGQSEESIKEDLEFLLARWNEILKMTEKSLAPAVLYRDQDLLYKVLRDSISTEVEKIVVDTVETRNRAVELLQSWSNSAFRLVHQNKSHIPLAIQYNLFGELEKTLQKKVALPSGGYLIIENTEALTVIDVNSGSAQGTNNLNDTILQTNKEAAVEVARQIRLRDIGGVIVVDFIDMMDQRHQQIVWQALANATKGDKGQPQLGYFSEFSLLELTRHRQKKSMLELLTSKCIYCEGTGRIRNSIYRADLLNNESIQKRIPNPESITVNKTYENKSKTEELSVVDYVEDRTQKAPYNVEMTKRSQNSNEISYPKYDRNMNRYDDVSSDNTANKGYDTVEIADVGEDSFVETVIENVVIENVQDNAFEVPEIIVESEVRVEKEVKREDILVEKEAAPANDFADFSEDELKYIQSVESYDRKGRFQNVRNKNDFRGNNRNDNRNENRVDNRPDNRNENRVDNRPNNRNENRVDNRPNNRNENRVDNRPDNRNENRVDNRPDNRNDNRVDNRPDNRNENRVDNIPDNSNENRVDNRPDNRNDNYRKDRNNHNNNRRFDNNRRYDNNRPAFENKPKEVDPIVEIYPHIVEKTETVVVETAPVEVIETVKVEVTPEVKVPQQLAFTEVVETTPVTSEVVAVEVTPVVEEHEDEVKVVKKRGRKPAPKKVKKAEEAPAIVEEVAPVVAPVVVETVEPASVEETEDSEESEEETAAGVVLKKKTKKIRSFKPNKKRR